MIDLRASWTRAVSGLLALSLLAGCAAGEKNFSAGEELLRSRRVEEALGEYRRALAQDPTNARYRVAYLNARDQSVQQWVAEADRLRADPTRSAEARALYQRALGIDPDNFRAREGLAALERDQRLAEALTRARQEAAQGNQTLALGWLRGILAERPQHAGALALQAQLMEQRARPKAAADAQLAAAFRKPVSLEFRDAQLKQVFEVLSRSSGLNFVLDKDVRGDQRTTLFLRNSTVADALSLALVTNQLEQRVLDAHSVLIFPNTPAKVREYQQLTVRAFVLSNGDTKTVSNTLKTLLKAKDIVVDEKQNMIIMRDSPEAIELAEKLVALHDQPEAEVMLEVEILEVKRTRLRQLGVQYPSQVALAPMTAASAALTLSDLKHLKASTTSVSDLSIGLQASETNTDVNVLANPRIRSRNREKAKIQVGQRVPNISSSGTATGFITETVQYVDVGLKLEVEPTVTPDGEVAIKVGLEVSNILQRLTTKNNSVAYEIGTRNANTVLRLKDGENQVLAGLINDEDRRTMTGLPGLVNAPGIGGTLFGNSTDDYQKSEIVLSITPRIIRSAFRPDLAIGEFLSGTETNLRSRGIELTGSTPPAASAAPASGAMGTDPAKATGPDMPPGTVNGPAADSKPITNAAASVTESSGGPATWPAGLSWRGQSSVTVGGLVALELVAQSTQSLSVIPLALSYDPTMLSLVSVDQGDYLAKAGSNGSLSKRADPATGQIRAVMTATGAAASPAEGTLLRLVFKALAASDGTAVSMPEPVKAISPAGEPVVMAPPAAWPIRITP